MTASYFYAWKRGEDMAADGSLKFDTKIDTSGLEKGTGPLEKDQWLHILSACR